MNLKDYESIWKTLKYYLSHPMLSTISLHCVPSSVGNNSILRNKCKHRICKCCSGIKCKLSTKTNFICKVCKNCHTNKIRQQVASIVSPFFYLRDDMAGYGISLNATTAHKWYTLENFINLFQYYAIRASHLITGHKYETCMRSTLLYDCQPKRKISTHSQK